MVRKYKTEDEYEMIPLSNDELRDALKKLEGWEQLNKAWIARKYTFDEYLDGVDFAKKVGEYAQKRMHHPTIKIDYKKVMIEISSWRAKGVTELDIEMVQDFNDIYDQTGDFA